MSSALSVCLPTAWLAGWLAGWLTTHLHQRGHEELELRHVLQQLLLPLLSQRPNERHMSKEGVHYSGAEATGTLLHQLAFGQP